MSEVGVSFDTVKKIALALPGVTEGITHGSPSFTIGKKFMGVLGDGDILIMKSAIVERDLLVQLEPDKYFITDHYVPFDYVLVRMSHVNEDEVRDLFRKAWRRLALKKLVKENPEI
ncbi:MAG: MmcQ/YjbR family DNA-binding protein [Chloroflexota bacterium]|nr:MmcQ/YjbR family DNA-binding protein [Anaerolineae bacterium]